MDKYVTPCDSSPSPAKPKILARSRWKRIIAELDGRVSSKYRHEISRLLIESYSKIGAFHHLYHIGGQKCATHLSRINAGNLDVQTPIRSYSFKSTFTHDGIKAHKGVGRAGISGLEFDTKGIFLASATNSGCLTVHDFESLYCTSNGLSSRSLEDETKHLLHLSAHQPLCVVRWNPNNQDEVACTSMQSNEVLLFDIGYISSTPSEVLRKRPRVTVQGCDGYIGLSDIAFSSTDKSRLLASDLYGVIHIWDRRLSDSPCLELTSNSQSALNSVQLNVDDRIVYGASKQGIVYAWDLRGGRTSIAFQSHNAVYHPPLLSMKLASMLEKITSLKAQSAIFSSEIHSINLDPSCPYQLAFHLDNGWSGVLNVNSTQVTHMHCPPPAWLNGADMTNYLHLRKPSWLPTCSIYAVGSTFDFGIHLLDFYPDVSSTCHVEFNEEIQNILEEKNRNMHNRFLPLSEGITVCAAHPRNGTIIAGTKKSSLLIISQWPHSYGNEDCCPNSSMRD